MRRQGDRILLSGQEYILTKVITADRGDGAAFYEAIDPGLGRKVGLKEIRGGKDILAAAEREIQAIIQLRHTQIPTVLQKARDRNSVFLVLEFVEGMTLRQYISGVGNEEIVHSFYRGALRLMINLCDILEDIHRQGYYHRDLNPNNIVLHRSRCYLIDFGVTVAPRRVKEGTRGYAAPEQEHPVGLRRALTATVDTFAVGLMTMELLTGRLPILRKRGRRDEWDDPELPTELNPMLPAEVDKVIAKAIAYSPEERYQDARSLRFDLQKLQRMGLGQPSSGVENFS